MSIQASVALPQQSSTHTRRAHLSRHLINALALVVTDALAISFSIWFAFQIRAIFYGPTIIPKLAIIALPAWLASAWLVRLYPGWGLSPAEELRRISKAVFTTSLLTIAVIYFANSGPAWARIVLLVASAFAPMFAIGMRAFTRAILARFGFWGVPVAVIGAARTGEQVVRSLRFRPAYGFIPVAVYDDDPDKHHQRIGETRKQPGIPVLGPIKALDTLSAEKYAAIFVAIPGLAREDLLELMTGPLQHVPKVFLIPDFFGVQSLWVEAREIGSMLTLEVQRNLLRPESRVIKRIIDLGLAMATGLLTLPLLGILAILIKFDSKGPVFFAHRRIGFDGREFYALKFRTMHPDAEATLEHYLAKHPELRQEWEQDHKLRNDPRVTRIGRLLRRSSLDELPQIWNIIRGHMSWVGPRPIVRNEVEKYGQAFELLSQVPPGMTGLWQVSGRNDTGYEERVRLDGYYIRNWSVWLDAVILLRTIRVVLLGKGAY